MNNAGPARPPSPERHAILLTGFGPFPGVPVNATEKLVVELAWQAGNRFVDWRVEHAVLPVDWEAGPAMSRRLISRLMPRLVLHFGVSDLATGLVIETLAANTCRSSPDTLGRHPTTALLDEGAAPALPARIPVAKILERIGRAGLPVETSEDAGGYLCNAVLFDTLRNAPETCMVGFIHVPTVLAAEATAVPAAPSRHIPGAAVLTHTDAIAGGLAIIEACLENVEPEA